jgi:hypothetical protein
MNAYASTKRLNFFVTNTLSPSFTTTLSILELLIQFDGDQMRIVGLKAGNAEPVAKIGVEFARTLIVAQFTFVHFHSP